MSGGPLVFSRGQPVPGERYYLGNRHHEKIWRLLLSVSKEGRASVRVADRVIGLGTVIPEEKKDWGRAKQFTGRGGERIMGDRRGYKEIQRKKREG